MRKSILSILGIGLALVLVSSPKPNLTADTSGPQEDASLQGAHDFSGTVDSFGDAEITVSDKEKSYKFKIDDKTQIKGKLVNGAKVLVVYKYIKIFKAYLIKQALVIKVIEEKK